MNKIFQFGEVVQGYDQPVLNEREIRAAAGLLFALMFLSILMAILKGNFVLLKYAIVIFLVDISIRVFINPKFSPTLILGRLIVRNQVPEYVGAPQKKFAWIIGFVLGLVMLGLQIIANTYGPITGMICMICLVFLFCETSFGICIGCLVYRFIFKKEVKYCPGEICEVKDRVEIQKTSLLQLVIVLFFIGSIFVMVPLFKDNFSIQPSPFLAPDTVEAVHREG